MDNAKIHKGEMVRELIEEAGARLIYLPPYSPEFSPRENFWSKVKDLLKNPAARTYKDLIDGIVNAMLQVTQKKYSELVCSLLLLHLISVRIAIYAYAAVAPELGQMTASVLPYANTKMMNLFLQQVSEDFQDYFIIMQVDKAARQPLKKLGNSGKYAPIDSTVL